MNAAAAWKIDETMLLSRPELGAVLTDLTRKAKRSINTWMNLVIVRLACCCGLRVSEINRLRLDDMKVGITKPYIRVRKAVGKGKKARRVPLWWDAGTLADLTAWKVERENQGATLRDLFICSMLANMKGRPLTRQAVRKRFVGACKILGPDRVNALTIHHGRHTFISHALAGGRTLAEVRDAAGHSNVSVTSAYLHIAVDDDGQLGDLFRFE